MGLGVGPCKNRMWAPPTVKNKEAVEMRQLKQESSPLCQDIRKNEVEAHMTSVPSDLTAASVETLSTASGRR